MTLLSKQQIHPGVLAKEYTAHLERAEKVNPVKQIIDKNPAVFKKGQKIHQKVILNRLGWIDVVDQMPDELARLEKLARDVREDGIKHVFILGMGGSSLCPEVFGEIFGRKAWLKSYTVVDTTAPSQIEEINKTTDFRKAFFIVSSKSGTTIETISQFRYFFKVVKEIHPLKAGKHFAAITDEGSDLHRIARRNRFRELFLNRSDIGGRYSALSYFGLVPGVFTQVNLAELLKGAHERLEIMKRQGHDCDALKLGSIMGIGAARNIDKLGFHMTPTLAPFVAWVEQLVAESTGKEMKGIVPVDDGPETDDCIDIYYSIKGEKSAAPSAATISGHPAVSIEMSSPVGIGAEMIKWEMATAVASSVLGVNPFDEPNVAESKKNTEAMLHSRRGPRKAGVITPMAEFEDVGIISATGIRSIERRRRPETEDIFRGLFKGVRKGDYVALLSYTERSSPIENRLAKIRQIIEKKFGLVTLRGYGPRFLHSTGQLFKGGSQKGHFIVLERDYQTDYDIPGRNISFGRLIKAQAKGDIKALQKRKRPVVDIDLRMNPTGGLDQLAGLIENL